MLKKSFEKIDGERPRWFRESIKNIDKQRQRVKQGEKDRRELIKKMKWILTLFLITISIYATIRIYNYYVMSSQGVKTVAIITQIRHEQYRVNALGGEWVDHYFVHYKYQVNKKWKKGLSEITFTNYSFYLGANAKKGDTIRVKYLSNNPSTVELIKYSK